jgi:transcriptional regulator with XRE-family HTH domain
LSKVRELCGLIHSQYDSESDFARQLGWSRQRLNGITTGKREPNLEDVARMSAALNRPLDEIAQIFLREKSPNGQQMGGESE